MAVPNFEQLTLWTLASLTQYFKSKDFGVPVEFAQMAPEKDDPKPNKIQIVFDGPDWSRKGTKNERIGVVHVRLFVNTTYVPTDIYHHYRLKAKAAGAMQIEIALKRTGTAEYDGMIVGVIRPIPTESVKITTISVEEPDGSIVDGTYCVHLC